MPKYFDANVTSRITKDSAQHINARAFARLVTYDVREVTCRETTAGHLWVFGGIAPLRCVLYPGWRGERDSCLQDGSDAFRASQTTSEQSEAAQSHSLTAQPVKH